MPNKVEYLEPSTIETIDLGMYNYIDKTLDLHTKTNKGFKKVPVLWLGSERVHQIKKDKEIRDSVGKIKFPLITINRDSVAKDPSFKGTFQADLKENKDYRGGIVTRVRRIQQEKTRNHANAKIAKSKKNSSETGKPNNNKKVVYEFLTSPIPVYVTVMYTINLRTEYQQQMNDLMTPFITKTGQLNNFIFDHNGHKYEAFIQADFSENKNTTSLNEEERTFETKINIKVLGYLIGEGINRENPQISVRENIVEVKISRERVIVGDKAPWKKKDKDYRE